MVYRFIPLFTALCLAAPATAQEEAFDCLIEPARIVTLAAPDGGLLSEVGVTRGDTVAAGDVIARLDSAVEEGSLAVLAARAESRAELEAQEARLALAISQRDRRQTLVDRNIAATGELEEAEATVQVARSEVATATLQRRLAELELERARAVLDRLVIKSPIDGVVTRVFLSPGEFTDQSNPVLQIAQLDPLYVEVFLPIRLFGSIAPADTAIVRPAEPISGTYEGQVTVVNRVFDAASGTFGVRVALDNPDLALPAGLRCKVSF